MTRHFKIERKSIWVKKSVVSVIMLLGISLLCGGCWDRTELNEVAICVAMSIEKTSSQRYTLSFQVLNPGSIVQGQIGGAKGASSSTTYTTTGMSIDEATRKATQQMSRRMLFSHMAVIVIDSKIAKDGIKKILDIFERDNEMRLQTNVVIARDVPASKVLSLVTTMERIPANQMTKQLEMTEELWGESHHIHVNEVIRQIANRGKELTVSGIGIAGDPTKLNKNDNTENIHPASTLVVKGIAVFHEDKLADWLDHEQARGYLWTQKMMKRTVLRTDCLGQKEGMTIDIYRQKAKLHVVKDHGRYVLKVNIQTAGSIKELGGCTNELLTNAKLVKLDHQVSQQIEEEIKSTVKRMQKQKLDIFGFGSSIDRSNRKEWRKIQNNWNDLFSTAQLDVHVDMLTANTGMIMNSTNKR